MWDHARYKFCGTGPYKFNKRNFIVRSLFMVALWNRADHYSFILWFLSIFFFSSPNLSGRTLDVSHTSTHGVALVQI